MLGFVIDMMRRILSLFRSLFVATTIIAGGGYSTLASESKPVNRPSGKILIVVLENSDYSYALKQSGLASLAEQGAVLTQFHAEAHPSQPNYIALISGDLHGVRSDAAVDLPDRHVGDLLEAKGRSWKEYLEDYPGKCFRGWRAGNYVRKHNPFASFSNVTNSPVRCDRMVSAEQLRQDIRNGALPDLALYIPNLKNDGHDTNVAFASQWLSQKFLPLLGDPLPKDLLLVVTFDESASAKDNRILTVLFGAGVRPGALSGAHYDHYSLLRTIEDRFNLGTLGLKDAQAVAISDIWR